MYRQDPIVKTAQQIVLNRLTRNRAFRKMAIGPVPAGPTRLPARRHWITGYKRSPSVIDYIPTPGPDAGKAGRNLWQAFGKIWAKPVGRYGTIGAGGLAGAYGLYRLLAGGGGEEPVVPAAPAAPVVPVAPPSATPALPETPADAFTGPAAYSAGGGQVIPFPVGVSDFASYLDLLRANQPIAGAAVGALGGAALGAGTSRKNRIRNALIGLVAGAALGGGAGYLTQGRI